MDTIKWQPMLVITNQRINCQCGNMAVIISGRQVDGDGYNVLEDVDCWCQDCFIKQQEEETSNGK